MAKWSWQGAYDAKLATWAECDEMHLCAAQPGTYAEATGAYSLGSVSLTPGDGNGDYTISDHSSGGRPLTIAAQSTTPVAGQVNHVALVKTGDSTLRLVNTTPVVTVSATATEIGSWTATDKGVS